MNYFKKISTIGKIILLPIFIFALFIIFNLYHINDKSTQIKTNWLPSTIHLNNINNLTSDFRIYELHHILTIKSGEMELIENNLSQKTKEINDEITIYKTLITTETEKALFEKFDAKWKEYLAESKIILSLSKENRNAEAGTLIKGKSKELYEESSVLLKNLVKENKINAEKASDRGDTLFFISLSFIFLFVVILIFSDLKLTKYLLNNLRAPMSKKDKTPSDEYDKKAPIL